MSADFLQFRGTRHANRDVFISNYPELFRSFYTVDHNFLTLTNPLATQRSTDGTSLAGLVPVFLVMQRQSRSAFDAIVSHQGYEAWVLIRPCLELALFIGRWLDEPDDFKIWLNRSTDRKSYAKRYSGKGLVSSSLDKAKLIRAVLARVNDAFLHPNPDYVGRHLRRESLEPGFTGIGVDFFEDGPTTECFGLALLHLLLVLQTTLQHALADRFEGLDPDAMGLGVFEKEFAERAQALLETHQGAEDILIGLGLWPRSEGTDREVLSPSQDYPSTLSERSSSADTTDRQDVVVDPETSLMWTARSNDLDINWDDALEYARTCRAGGHSDWRLPTLHELQTLFRRGAGEDREVGGYLLRGNIRLGIELTESRIWSANEEGEHERWYLEFDTGERGTGYRGYANPSRVLCVRGEEQSTG